MSSNDYAFISITVGSLTFSTLDAESQMSMNFSRITNSISESLMISMYDKTGIDIETELKNAPKLSLQYGWSNGATSPVYDCNINSYSIDFTSSVGDSVINIEAQSTGLTDSVQNYTMSYNDEKIDDIVRIIAARNGWVEGHIEPTKVEYEDGAKKIMKSYKQSNQTDEEFITKVLAPSAVSSETNRGNYEFFLKTLDSGQQAVYFQPRVPLLQAKETENKLPLRSSSNYVESFKKEEEEQSLGGEINVSGANNNLEWTYVLGSTNNDDIISISMTYNGGIVNLALGDGLDSEVQDDLSNDYLNTRVTYQSDGQDQIIEGTPPSQINDNQNPVFIDSSDPVTTKYPRGQNFTRLDKFVASVTSKNGRPYVWGADGKNDSYDCSGLLSYGLREAGYLSSGRLSSGDFPSQKIFTRVPTSRAKAGDILYRPGHVELYLGGNQTFGAHNERSGIGFTNSGPGGYTMALRLKNSGGLTLNTPQIKSSKNWYKSGKMNNSTRSLRQTSNSLSGLEAQSISQFDSVSNIAWSGSITVIGDPMIEPGGTITLTIYTADGSEHPSSGDYKIMKVDDGISGGDFTSTVELVSLSSPDIDIDSYDMNGLINSGSYSGISSDRNTKLKTNKSQFANSPISRGHGNTVYYNQGDNEWQTDGLAMRSSGCGPTSVAMIISSLTGKKITPVSVAKYARSTGQFSNGIGTLNTRYFTEYGNKYGYKVVHVTSRSEHKKMLSKGYIGINHHTAGGYWCRSTGHFTVAAGITPSGQMLVNDPGSRSRSKVAVGDSLAYDHWDGAYFYVPK